MLTPKKIFTAFILAVSNQLYAQHTPEADTSYLLNETQVIYQAGKTTPVTYQNISSTDLKVKYSGQEPSFLLSEYPSITNYSDAGSFQGYSYMRLRGIDQTRINITLDGVPLNEPEDQGAYFSNYPDIFNSLSKVQIQRGIGTSKNGVASYAGSIALFSPDLYDSAKTTLGVGYGSFNSMRLFGELKTGIRKHIAFYGRASETRSDGYKYNSSNNSRSIFISTGLFYEKTAWKLNIVSGHQQNQLAWLGVKDSLIELDRRTNANHRERDNFFQSLAQLQNHWQISRSSSVQTSCYYTFLTGNYDFDLNTFLGLPETNELYNYAFRSNLLGFFSNYTFSKKKFNVTAGVHGNIYDRQHIGSEKTIGQLYQNTGYKREISGFTKANYSINWLTLFADIQLRYATFDYKGSVPLEKLDWQFFNPKTGISARLNHNYTLYYSVGRTGREPTRNDLFGGSDDLLADSSGNALLSIKTPEYVLDHEIGCRYNSKKLNLSLDAYFMDFKNEIVLDGKLGPNGLALTDKVDQSFRTGIEASARYKMNSHFELINNSSYNYSRIKELTETFSPILTPQFTINQEFAYSFKKVSLAISARYQDGSFIDFANTAKLDGYFLLNMRAGYNIKRFQFSAFVNNITNSKYYSSGYIDFDGSKKYFVQAPLNVYTSVNYSF